MLFLLGAEGLQGGAMAGSYGGQHGRRLGAGFAHVQAGAGVVYDSKPQAEADETRAKAERMTMQVSISPAPFR